MIPNNGIKMKQSSDGLKDLFNFKIRIKNFIIRSLIIYDCKSAYNIKSKKSPSLKSLLEVEVM